MAQNKFLTIADISYMSADVLSNSLGFTSKVNRNYDDRFAKTGAKIGDTTSMRLPAQFRFSSGSAIDIQALNDKGLPLTLNKQYQRSFQMDNKDLTLSIDDFNARYLRPALISMANEIDYDGLQLARRYAANAVGTVGTAPASTADLLGVVGEARQKLMENLAPVGETLNLVATPAGMQKGFKYLTQTFNPQTTIGEQYKTGRIYNAGGFDWMEEQLVPTYSAGTYGGTPKVNGASQSGSTLVTDGWSAGTTLDEGAVFTIAGVYAVNAQTKVAYGHLQQFTVTAKNTAGAAQTLSISPEIIGPGDPRQNVSALPADNADITVFGATGVVADEAIAFHKNAFVFGCADLAEPVDGATGFRASVPELGLSVVVTKQFDIRSYANIMRIDLLGGWAPLYNQLACKVALS